ncbi:phosphoenolpyruvate synthase [Reyranella sp.]|jgi:pyruvate,water dikinase|uniref:phosphoenolpyruvate synthase n=1 Tax=Reyranella sp. TaxID=1929291 RepID=UPI000BDC5B59|nr:phosphoenolpyruvate synthase [Reyranella sp.]OYY47075.1 MAG: phosphoenolpyruvate synthase [Rhodospirillales bacterium 35-66-84]OYZ97095.1 MAG: phosphoenolpyruvate synthase [Rhodospirillales bacterium 24-66-33]OZB27577.1 MAG: phosphoenolpyruvate synthase [Rhodospirillales bacterium 39-66-50]HQS14009.1 phosphoenolpyruvate synthase [Reyranella sp.]HQT10494.1 phosphoenolpyruvate synthase [Reyranella sp.]
MIDRAAAGVRWFREIRSTDLASVGGKNASLGEMVSALGGQGVRVPDGFALTADVYREALLASGAWPKLAALLDGVGANDVGRLARAAAEARALVYAATGTDQIRTMLVENYRKLEAMYGARVAVAVRSSATAEDLPTASFAGQHDSFLNVQGITQLEEACRKCFASAFTDRAIVYRNANGFDHLKVGLSIGIMKMVRSDLAASGVTFTLDTESGFRDVVLVTGVWGLGESIVQGKVDPDEFHVHKPTFRAGKRCVLRRSLGRKQQELIYGKEHAAGTTVYVETPADKRDRFCISDAEVLELTNCALRIEAHYSQLAGEPRAMDIEWAKDGPDGELFIVQARPETVVSRRAASVIETYRVRSKSAPLVEGRAVGERAASGAVYPVSSAADLPGFPPGAVLVASSTSPDWEPAMKRASAIVTDRGGRTCHAAIVAREHGIPAIVGAGDATTVLRKGARVTVSCAEGETGRVYPGDQPIEIVTKDVADLARPRTPIMVNLGNPDLAFRTAMRPNEGVGLARMEFIVNQHIGVHPMALAHPEKVTDPAEREQIARLTRHFDDPKAFFIERLSEGIGTIAAAFHPKPVIVRLSDFKTNEYAKLLGGRGFEPREENPMLGFRGASRYTHPAYADGFALECAALRRVRDDMGLENVRIMVPFCRRVEEGAQVIAALAKHGLTRGQNGLEVYVMCEIPNNVIQIDAFARLFDGFSIGSNDLTQLVLGVDRDSDMVSFEFDERDPGVLEMLRLAIEGAHRNGRHVGICGEAPANYPEIASFLTKLGIDSISVNPESVAQTMEVVFRAEA